MERFGVSLPERWPKLLDETKLYAFANRVDQIINIDFGNRGVEHLFESERAAAGEPLTLRAARRLQTLTAEDTVLVTTGSVSRSWISSEIGENDGPAGTAALVRAIALGTRATVVLVAEASLIPVITKMMIAAGVTILGYDAAVEANRGGTLLAASVRSFTTSSRVAPADAVALLEELSPSLLISVERTGRNEDGIYCSMRGVDYGQERARIDFVFDEATRRNIPSIAVGDGGNEIGMGNVADAVRQHIPFGDRAAQGGAGIGAMTQVDSLVTAACSNWGAYGIVAVWAALAQNSALLHTPAAERFLLQRGVEIGLINSVAGRIDDRVDDIPSEVHVSLVTFIDALARKQIQTL